MLNIVRSASFTRLSNTTQYAAGDAVSDDATTATAATFTLLGMGNSGRINSVTLHKSDDDLTGADFDIYFFDTQPVGTGYEDNVAIAITDTEWQSCVGFVSFVGSTDGRSVQNGNVYTKTNLDLPYQTLTNNNLYFVIVARGTYTPASAEVVTLRVGATICN